ncbi:ATP synthase subunit a [Lemmus lemmus]
MIKTISLLIQPMVLAVCLTVNITAGHLLIHLIVRTTLVLTSINTPNDIITFIILALLNILDFSIALIQAYVFTLIVFTYTTTHIDPPNTCISYSKPKLMTSYRNLFCPPTNF